MARTVFNNSMVAHVWAQQTQPEGRSGNGHFYFKGATIYSYGGHFPIARFTTDALGRRCVLFTNGRYGITTAQHMNYTRRALNGLNVTVWHTSYVEHGDHAARVHDVAALVSEYEAQAVTLAKPHVARWKELAARLVELRDAAQHIVEYAAAWGVPSPDLAYHTKVAAIHTAFLRYNDPKAVAKRERASATRCSPHYKVAALHLAYLEGVTAVHPTREQWKRLPMEMKRELTGSRFATPDYLCPLPARHTLTAPQWVAGEGGMNELPYTATTITLVRKQGDRLQTSRGAEVPWAHAVAVFRKAQQCRLTGTAWHANGEQMKIGFFSLASVDTEGNITAGCHHIEWSEMFRLAMREIPHAVKPQFPLPALIMKAAADVLAA